MNSLCLLKFIVIPKSVWAIVENFSCPVGMFPDEVEQRLTGANSHSNQCHFCGLGRDMIFPFLCGFFELFVYWCFFFSFSVKPAPKPSRAEVLSSVQAVRCPMEMLTFGPELWLYWLVHYQSELAKDKLSLPEIHVK